MTSYNFALRKEPPNCKKNQARLEQAEERSCLLLESAQEGIFGVGVQAGGLIGTAVNFLASPVTNTFQRLVGREPPEDGQDVCAMRLALRTDR